MSTQVEPSCPVLVFPGAGGGTPDLKMFREHDEDTTRFDVISYPGWKTYIKDEDYSAETLVRDLAAHVATRVPRGPIHIIGLSIGAHFGYATALRLQAMGREVAGFCAIDSFMIASTAPSPGWRSRAFVEGSEMVLDRKFGELWRFVRSKLWRALVRLAGRRLDPLLQRLSSVSWLSSALVFDPILEQELTMRLLLLKSAPWIAGLDVQPVVLDVPTVLLRTNLISGDDAAWLRRCPNLKIFEISGRHDNLFNPEHFEVLRKAFIAATCDWH